MTTFIEKIVDLGDKRRWRQYKARQALRPTARRSRRWSGT